MKYDGCEVVRVCRSWAGTPSVFDQVRASDGTVLLEDYIGDIKAGFLDAASASLLKNSPSGTHFRLVGQLSLEPLTEAKVDEREPSVAG